MWAWRGADWTWRPGGTWTWHGQLPDAYAGGLLAAPGRSPVLFAGPDSTGAFVHDYRWSGTRWVGLASR
jgi:hypothetical protein